MPKKEYSRSYLKSIPNLNLSGDVGGTSVFMGQRDNEIVWESLSLKYGFIETAMVQNGMRLIAGDLGISMMYDNEGDLSETMIDVRKYLIAINDELPEMIKDHDDLIDIIDVMEDSGKLIFIDVNCKNKSVTVIKKDVNPPNKAEMISTQGVQTFNDGVYIPISYFGREMMFGCEMAEDGLVFGIGIAERNVSEDKIEDYINDSEEEFDEGEMPLDEDSDEEGLEEMDSELILLRKITDNVNWPTYLDGERPDRFEKLAKRILLF